MGCDPRYRELFPETFLFQSTHPHGVRLKPSKRLWELTRFQSTHPHGVRRVNLFVYIDIGCFNPRTRMGCDKVVDKCVVLQKLFQSTHPHGVRLIVFKFFGVIRVVSIHAPAWGATSDTANSHIRRLFQSTHPHGVRPDRKFWKRVNDWFQSTHPHGVRLYWDMQQLLIEWFQSTHPHGVRPNNRVQVYAQSSVSIHAPAWGATGATPAQTESKNVSIHAPAWGATSTNPAL